VPGLGVVGAAWATVIAQALAVALYLWMILSSRRNALLRVRWPFRVDWRLQGKLLRIGVPSGAQFLLATVGLGLTYRAVRPFGAEVSAAVGVGFRILQSMLYPAISVAAAAASLTGQNTGARRAGRVRETLYLAAALGVGVTLVQWLALIAAPRFWLGIFADDPAIVEAGTSYLLISGLAMVFGGFAVVVTFASQALGRTMLPLLAAVVRVVLFGAALLAMDLWLRPSPELIFLGYTAAVVVESGVLGWIFRGMLRGTRAWEAAPEDSLGSGATPPVALASAAPSEASSGAAP
jgi:Na+-driven multidrug efflux pump